MIWTGDEVVHAICPLSVSRRPHLMRLRLSDGVERCAWCALSVAELRELAATARVNEPGTHQQ